VSRVRKVLVGLVVVLAVGAVVVLGLVPGVPGQYGMSTPALAAAFRAKETCSCVFVEARDEDYCRGYTAAAPDIARATVDRQAKEVSARALWLWTARARFEGEGRGCALE
jgi:hypothetical protein